MRPTQNLHFGRGEKKAPPPKIFSQSEILEEKLRREELWTNMLNMDAEKANIQAKQVFDATMNKKASSKIVKETKPADNLEDLFTSEEKRHDFMANPKIMLTYEGEIDIDEYTSWMQKLSKKKDLKVKSITFSYTGEVTHILIIWDKRFQSRNV